MEQGEIVIYRANDKTDFQLKVRVENETVWLTQAQMVKLFNSTKQNISLHINNIFKEGELQPESTVKEYLTVQKEGKRQVKGVFYDGQIFDAHLFVSRLVKTAIQSIILVDNYVDESVLFLLAKRKPGVQATIYTATVSRQLSLDVKRFNAQYPEIEIKTFNKSHDRFLIIDHHTVYHIGASLKDLGKKWFAFSKIGLNALEMIEKLEKGN
jgi:hypothetical protein